MTEQESEEVLARLRAAVTTGLDGWMGLDLVSAGGGKAELAVATRPELLQHAGFLHAGVLGALIDRSCGFAAASLAGPVLASQYQVRCYRPGIGTRFVARAHIVRAGKRQLFALAEVFAVDGGEEKLIAGGDAVLITA